MNVLTWLIGTAAIKRTSSIAAAPFRLMFERTTDVATSEVAFLTSASFADLTGHIASGGAANSPIDVAPSFVTTGLASQWQRNGGGDNGTVPEPGTFALLGLADPAAARRRKQ